MALALRKEEGLGLGIAIAAHVALVAVLLLRPHNAPVVQPPERIEVTISDQVAPTSTSPQPRSQAAPDEAPTAGEPKPQEQAEPAESEPEPKPPEPAPPQPAPPKPAPPKPTPPRPTPPKPAPPRPTPPTPKPVPRKVERPAPKPTPKPVPRAPERPRETARPAPARPTPARPAPARPAAAKPAARPAAKPSPQKAPAKASPQRSPQKSQGQGTAKSPPPRAPARSNAPAGGSKIGSDFLAGVTGAKPAPRASTNAPAAAIGPAVKASLGSAISRQLKPHWQVPQGADAELLVTKVRFRLNRDGTLAGEPQVVSTTGQNDTNAAQVKRHQEQAIRAVRLAAPFNLPDEYYDGWKVITTNFDRRLAQ